MTVFFFSENTWNKHERSLLRLRNKHFPTCPRTATEVQAEYSKNHVMQGLGYTNHEDEPETFYKMAYQAQNLSYCIFASTRNINHMNDKIPNAEKKF
jgi:hypothetical protein